MADKAFQTMYRQEHVKGFEKRQSLLRRTVTTEAMIRGNSAVFLVADSGGASAVTRGVNGDIPTRTDNLNQYTATLVEWHDVPERTNFNIFSSQGEGRRIMQETCMSVMNRQIDTDIHVALGGATTFWNAGEPAVATLARVLSAYTTLGNNFALEDDDVFAAITPAYYGQLAQLNAFTSADYINQKPFENVAKSRAFNWMGINFIVDAGLPGKGTTNSSCYMYSRKAIGHAMATDQGSSVVGYDDKNHKSWARSTEFMGSKLMQNSGVVVMPHDDSTLSI